jgi:hypothetical protein
MKHSPKTQSPHETRCQAKRVKLNVLLGEFGVFAGDTSLQDYDRAITTRRILYWLAVPPTEVVNG